MCSSQHKFYTELTIVLPILTLVCTTQIYPGTIMTTVKAGKGGLASQKTLLNPSFQFEKLEPWQENKGQFHLTILQVSTIFLPSRFVINSAICFLTLFDWFI